MTELYEIDGKIGVLVSPGYGAGWSTWEGKELAYDKRVIEFWLEHKDNPAFMSAFVFGGNKASTEYSEAEEFFKSIGYERCPYMGGFKNIELVFVPRGVPWTITEYDGYEELETLNDFDFTVF